MHRPSITNRPRPPSFESNLFNALSSLLGTRAHTHDWLTTPSPTGLVERFHRQLKASLKAQDEPNRWTENAPSCSAWPPYGRQNEILVVPQQRLVYGTTLRLPGTVCGTGFMTPVLDPAQIMCTGSNVQCVSWHQGTYTVTWPPLHSFTRDLLSCTHVFLSDVITWQPPLQPPYKGPYRVLDRADKYYTLDIKGKRDTVSLDRLKVAYLDVEHSTDLSPPSRTAHHSNPDHPPTIPLLPPGAGPTRPAQQAPQQTTRSGRRVHWPAHYAQFDCGWTLFFFNISFPSWQLLSGGGSCGDYLTFMYIFVNIYITWCERPINASFTRSLVRCTVLYIRCFLHWLFRWFLDAHVLDITWLLDCEFSCTFVRYFYRFSTFLRSS